MAEDSNKKSPLEMLLWGIGIISAIAFLFKIFDRSEEDENRERAQQSREEIYRKFPPTFEDGRYLDFADNLHMALLTDMGEDEEAVYDIFRKMRNISDVLKTIEFFGRRRLAFSTYEITLPASIGKLFDTSEKNKLNEILAKKKIPYAF